LVGDEGGTALIVGRVDGPGTSSSCTGGNLLSTLCKSSSIGDDGGDVPVEQRLDEGEKKAPLSYEVSGSEVVVDVDMRCGLRGCKGPGTNASCLVVATVGLLVGEFSSETRRPCPNGA
jgi:hypothetical protein